MVELKFEVERVAVDSSDMAYYLLGQPMQNIEMPLTVAVAACMGRRVGTAYTDSADKA